MSWKGTEEASFQSRLKTSASLDVKSSALHLLKDTVHDLPVTKKMESKSLHLLGVIITWRGKRKVPSLLEMRHHLGRWKIKQFSKIYAIFFKKMWRNKKNFFVQWVSYGFFLNDQRCRLVYASWNHCGWESWKRTKNLSHFCLSHLPRFSVTNFHLSLRDSCALISLQKCRAKRGRTGNNRQRLPIHERALTLTLYQKQV